MLSIITWQKISAVLVSPPATLEIIGIYLESKMDVYEIAQNEFLKHDSAATNTFCSIAYSLQKPSPKPF
jgi:hypothetical protein